MDFVSDFRAPLEPPQEALWFLFHDQRLLVRIEGDRVRVLESADLGNLGLVPEEEQFLGRLKGIPCYAGELIEEPGVPGDCSFLGLRRLMSMIEPELLQAAGLANQLVYWNRNHRYCGRCGTPTRPKSDERARICPQCGLVNYPRLSPAIIVAVIRDHKILLAHATRFPTRFYSVLAGFVEPGESLEQCVAREVREEVGIDVKNIRYFGSQHWPFPDSLMIGFTAEYAGGEIRIDPTEITDAGWFSADQLPDVPPRISIARRLIDWFAERNRGPQNMGTRE